MRALVEWFNPGRRQRIQLFFGSLAPLLIMLGFSSTGQTEQLLIIVGATLQFVASALSLANVHIGGWGAAWAAARSAIYALAATVSPALVLLGLYSTETNATLLTGMSLALSSLSSLLAIFVGKDQQIQRLTRIISSQS